MSLNKLAENANRGYQAAFASTLFLSTTAIFIRYLTMNFSLPSLILAFWREVFVALILLIVFLLFRPSLIKGFFPHRRHLVLYGFVLALFNGTWTLSVALNGAAVATVLAYSSTAFTALLGWLLLDEGLGAAKIGAVVLTIAGCALITGVFSSPQAALSTGGILTGLIAGLFYAFYSLLGRTASQKGINPWTQMVYIFCVAALVMLVINLVAGSFLPGGLKQLGDFFWLGNSLEGWGVLLMLAAVPTLMGYAFYNISLSHLPSSVVNLILTIEPVFTALIAYFFLGEDIGWLQIAGGLLIIFGVLLLRVGKLE